MADRCILLVRLQRPERTWIYLRIEPASSRIPPLLRIFRTLFRTAIPSPVRIVTFVDCVSCSDCCSGSPPRMTLKASDEQGIEDEKGRPGPWTRLERNWNT